MTIGGMDLSLVFLAMALLMCRILPVFVFSSILGGEATPAQMKIGVSLVLSLVMFPLVAQRIHNLPTSPVAFTVLLLKELFIGLSLAFIVGMVFEAARMAGNIVDSQSGSAQAQVQVPQLHEQVSIFSSFQLLLAIALFLTLDGHHVVIAGLADSLVSLPLDRFPQFSHGMWGFFELIMRVLREMMKLSISLAGPAIIVALLSEISLGIINRLAPQLQVYFLAMAVKPLVATLALFMAMYFIVQRMAGEFGNSLRMFQDAIRLLL
jgi:flagellar biosynthesis protein FliR